MAASSSSSSTLSSLHLNSLSTPIKPKPIPRISSYFPNSSSPPLISSLTLSLHPQSKFFPQIPANQTLILLPRKPRRRSTASSAATEDAAISAENAAQEIVSATSGDDGVSNVVSILLFVAFVGLSILTIGVIYIAVTDFLQKREKEKFEKEEAAKNKKKGGKKVKVKARAGPRGFGQKIEEDDDD